jgi:hypothetical protein
MLALLTRIIARAETRQSKFEQQITRVRDSLPNDLVLIGDASGYTIGSNAVRGGGGVVSVTNIAPSVGVVSYEYVNNTWQPYLTAIRRLEFWNHILVIYVHRTDTEELEEVVLYNSLTATSSSVSDKSRAIAELERLGVSLDSYIDTPDL